MVPVCHAAQMSSQVWKTFHVCYLLIITSQETTTICPQRIQAATHHYFLYRLFIFPIKMSENAKEIKCSLWFPRAQHDDTGLNPRDSLFNIMNDKEKQQFLTLKKLKSSKRLIFLLEKCLKWLIKFSCFVLCTYMFGCQRGGLPLDTENKQTQQVYWSESQQVFHGDCLWEVCRFHDTVLWEKWDRDGWRRLEDKRKKRGGGGEGETKEGGDERERGRERKRLVEKVEWGVREAETQNKREMPITEKIPGVEKELMMMMCQCTEDLSVAAAKVWSHTHSRPHTHSHTSDVF